jgi:hypothetical protein
LEGFGYRERQRYSGTDLDDAGAPQCGVELTQRNRQQPGSPFDQRVTGHELRVGPLGGLRRRQSRRGRVRDDPEPGRGRRRYYYFVVQNSGHDRLLRRKSNGHNGIRVSVRNGVEQI